MINDIKFVYLDSGETNLVIPGFGIMLSAPGWGWVGDHKQKTGLMSGKNFGFGEGSQPWVGKMIEIGQDPRRLDNFGSGKETPVVCFTSLNTN